MKIHTFCTDGLGLEVKEKIEEKDLGSFLFESQAQYQGYADAGLMWRLEPGGGLYGSDPRKVSPFSFYKSYEEDFLMSSWGPFIYRKLDYKNNSVRIIVTELDYRRIRFQPKVFPNFEINDDAVRLFNRTTEDQDILFSYVSTSGNGLRIAFKVDEDIKNEAQYITNLYYYTKMFKDRHDKENLFILDFCCHGVDGSMFNDLNHCRNYWLPPMKSSLNYNEEAKSLATI
jgi:hypothetical protein